MQSSQIHYLPLTLPFFFILAALFILLVVLLQVNILRYVYERMGISAHGALFLLLGSLFGGYFNFGGAGTFDDIFLAGVLAVLIASIFSVRTPTV